MPSGQGRAVGLSGEESDGPHQALPRHLSEPSPGHRHEPPALRPRVTAAEASFSDLPFPAEPPKLGPPGIGGRSQVDGRGGPGQQTALRATPPTPRWAGADPGSAARGGGQHGPGHLAAQAAKPGVGEGGWEGPGAQAAGKQSGGAGYPGRLGGVTGGVQDLGVEVRTEVRVRTGSHRDSPSLLLASRLLPELSRKAAVEMRPLGARGVPGSGPSAPVSPTQHPQRGDRRLPAQGAAGPGAVQPQRGRQVSCRARAGSGRGGRAMPGGGGGPSSVSPASPPEAPPWEL